MVTRGVNKEVNEKGNEISELRYYGIPGAYLRNRTLLLRKTIRV